MATKFKVIFVFLGYNSDSFASLILNVRRFYMALFDDVRAVIVEQLGVNADEVKENSNFIDDLNADSLDVVEMIMALEEKFGIEIPDQDAEAIKTVKDVVDYIEKAKQ